MVAVPRDVAFALVTEAEYTLHFNETDPLSDNQRGYVEPS
jgi:hypothetical protein